MKQEEPPEYGQMKKKALGQLRPGKPLYGKDGAFAPLLKSFLTPLWKQGWKVILMRLSEVQATGRTARPVRMYAPLMAPYPLIRPVTATPALGLNPIRKRETILAESLEPKTIGVHGLGMGLRDTAKHIRDMYDTETGHSTLSAITDKGHSLSKRMAINATG